MYRVLCLQGRITIESSVPGMMFVVTFNFPFNSDVFCASSYIGGAATLFILFAFASWSIFPLLHVGIAVLVSKKTKQDPSLAVFVISVFVVFLLLISLLLSGLFNFV
jgi:hypothetical protein